MINTEDIPGIAVVEAVVGAGQTKAQIHNWPPIAQ
jgi:hypothetical protein